MAKRCRIIRANTLEKLKMTEQEFLHCRDSEVLPFAQKTSLVDIAMRVVPDKEGFPVNAQGTWVNQLFFVSSMHRSDLGIGEVSIKSRKYLEEKMDTAYITTRQMDILSLMVGMVQDKLNISFVVRIYSMPENQFPTFEDLYEYLGETDIQEDEVETNARLKIPEEAIHSYSDEEIERHQLLVREQDDILAASTEEEPFLNRIDTYIPRKLYEVDPNAVPVYDLLTIDRQMKLIASYEDFIGVFQACMRYVNTIEKDSYEAVLRGQEMQNLFLDRIETFIYKNFVEKGLFRREDVHALMGKLERALFQLYIIQDLINDPDITDIKITSPEDIRVRVNGKAYLSNIQFIDDDDYARFIKALSIKNNVNLNIPKQTFTDKSDDNYILRFTITSKYITPEYPSVHVRKVARKKLMAPELIERNFFDEKIRDYLIDCGKQDGGVVFAGPPGSGKTVALNWFLEDAYEDSAEILVIQENDELFAYRHGVMFEHVVNTPLEGQQRCTLEDLGQMALVAGANVFIIGEAKGAEICSAITLSNSGCRTAITIHSPAATETLDKMADLAMRGYAQSYTQALQMIKSFRTIVYLQDFHVQEITEILGYDEKAKKIRYRYIYKRPEEE